MKEKILILLLAALLIVAPISFAQAQTDCPTELVACEDLLAECDTPDCLPCPELKDCSGAETFIQIITDVNVREAIIYIGIAIAGSIITLVAAGGG